MSTESPSRRHPIITSIALVAILGSAANALVSLGAQALGAPKDGMPFLPPAYITLTVLAAVVGTFGWRLVTARAQRPARTLQWLVPVTLLVSFTPDLYLGVTGAWTWSTVLGAAVMHVVTISLAVAIFAWQLPVPRATSARAASRAVPSSRTPERAA